MRQATGRQPVPPPPGPLAAQLPPAPGPASSAEAVLRPVRTGNAFEETVERLLQAIKLGVVPYGGRLPAERDLAARLAVSRATLRDALSELQQAGYVAVRRGRAGGTFVTYRPAASRRRTSARRLARAMGDELADALAFREVVEPGVAALAAERPSAAGRALLEEALAGCTGADLDHYRQLDSRLHLAVAEVASSPSLTKAVVDVRMRLNDLLDAIPLLPRNIRHSDTQHAAIVDAVLAGDPEAARRATLEHLAGTAALLRGFLG